MAAVTIEELVVQRDECKARVAELDAEYTGERFSEEAREEWNKLNEEIDELEKRIGELEARQQRVSDLEKDGSSERGAEFQVGNVVRVENIYDLSSVRRSYDDPAVEGQDLRDRAKKVLETAVLPHPDSERVDAKGHVERLIEMKDSDDGRFSRYLVATNAPAYRRAFPKLISPNGMATLTREEQTAVMQVKAAERALSLTGASGGFAVPFVLDPTIIPTSNLAVNPFRAISRVEQITVDEWRGVSSAGITAAYAAEATEASDNAPTLAQPTVSTEKAQAFIPFSIEIGMDWNGLQVEMARLLQDAKDELEASKFATGSGTNEPQGVITGATSTTDTATANAFVVADLYTLEAALGPRFRPRGVMVMNRAIAQKIRQFDTQGGASLWIDNLRIGLANQVPTPGSYGDGARVLGYGAYESSAMASTVTTGAKIIVFGDFSYYLIADRVGLSVELIPHMFATANNRPSGQRGLYAYWRNGAGVLSTTAFKVLDS
jgi:HK97 family phage major capsid protein